MAGGDRRRRAVMLVTDWLARALIRYARLHFRLFDTANQSI